MKLNETQREKGCPAGQHHRPSPHSAAAGGSLRGRGGRRCRSCPRCSRAAPAGEWGSPRLPPPLPLAGHGVGAETHPPEAHGAPPAPAHLREGAALQGGSQGRRAGRERGGGGHLSPARSHPPLTPPTNEWCLLTPGNLPPAKHCSALQNPELMRKNPVPGGGQP